MGYLKKTKKEPIILDKDDYSEIKWIDLCYLFGANDLTCSRIQLNIDSIKTYDEE